MALVNCKKISDISISVTKDQAISSSVNGVLFIEPINSSYVLDAANFTNNTGSIANISGITLANTTTAYAADNKVRVDVDLLDSFAPSADTELTIDIDGEATHVDNIPRTISGIYTLGQSSNITVSPDPTATSDEYITYSATGIAGETKTLLTITFTADSGYYLADEPEYEFLENLGHESNYTVTFFDKVYTDDLLTSVKAKVEWTFPAFDISDDDLIFSTEVEAVPVDVNLITGFEMDRSVIPTKGAFRDITITGSAGASFVFTVTNITANPNTTYDFSTSAIFSLDETYSATAGFTTNSTNLTGIIPASGQYIFEGISFPASETSIEYSFNLQGGTSPSTNTLLNDETNNDAYTWKIRSAELVTVFIGTTSTNVSSIISSTSLTNNVLLLQRGFESDTDTGVEFDTQALSIVLSGTKNLFVRRDPLFSAENQSESDFSNSVYEQNGGMWWRLEDLRVTGNGTTTLSILAGLTFIEVGTKSVESLLNLDNFINRAPVATTGITFDCKQGASQVITLTGTDADSDALTFVITADVNHGELYEIDDLNLATPIATFPHALTAGSKNKVLFKHDDSTNFNPTFSFKANDGFEDSVAAATVTGTVTASNTLPTATAASHPVNQGGAKIITLTGADGDNDALKFKITSLPSNGTLHTVFTGTTLEGFENPNAYYTTENQITTVPSGFLTRVVYKHGNNTNASDTFEFKANDGKDDSVAAATITLPINRRPVANLANINNFPRLSSQVITLTATDPDAGDSISKYFLTDLVNSQGAAEFRETATSPIITQNQMPYELSGNTFYYKNNYTNPTVPVSDLFAYKAQDSNGAFSEDKYVTINIIAPVNTFNGSGSVSGTAFNSSWTNIQTTINTLSSNPNGRPSTTTITSLLGGAYHTITVGTGGATIELLQYFNGQTKARYAKFIKGEVKFFNTISEASSYSNPLYQITKSTTSWYYGWGWRDSYDLNTAYKVGEVDLPAGTYVYRVSQQIIEYWRSSGLIQPRIVVRKKT